MQPGTSGSFPIYGALYGFAPFAKVWDTRPFALIEGCPLFGEERGRSKPGNLPSLVILQLKLVVFSKIITSQIRCEHEAANVLRFTPVPFGRHRRSCYENGAHRDNFRRAADRSDNSWRRQKASEFGSDQGSRLLQCVSADLSVAAGFRAVEFQAAGQVQ